MLLILQLLRRPDTGAGDNPPGACLVLRQIGQAISRYFLHNFTLAGSLVVDGSNAESRTKRDE